MKNKMELTATYLKASKGIVFLFLRRGFDRRAGTFGVLKRQNRRASYANFFSNACLPKGRIYPCVLSRRDEGIEGPVPLGRFNCQMQRDEIRNLPKP